MTDLAVPLPVDFDAAAYLVANPDVAMSGVDPVIHYKRYGRAEGRPLRVDMVQPSRAGTRPVAARERLSWALAGEGLELGPGSHPFVLPFSGVSVRYVDRWEPSENRDLFPELAADTGFPEPDIRANFDVDGLAPVDDESQDFVIASHVLEHLADPLGFLGEIHRVLRVGGTALILLPDKRFTFDRPRAVTSLGHLVEEHQIGVHEVSDDHIVEFIKSTSPHELPPDDAGWPDVIARHRLRSIHVHCWTEDDFPEVIRYAITDLAMRWELVDVATVRQGGPASIEFGYVLRRSASSLDAQQLARRFDELYPSLTAPRVG